MSVLDNKLELIRGLNFFVALKNKHKVSLYSKFTFLILASILVLQIISFSLKIIFPSEVSSVTYKNNLTFSAGSYLSLPGDPFKSDTNNALNQVLILNAPPTSLSLRLYGVIHSENEGLNSAILGFEPSKQLLYKLNDAIADNIFLEIIEPERVIISRNGIRESVLFDQESVLNLAKKESIKFTPEPILKKPNNLLNMMSFQPYFSNGTLKGYQIFPGKDSNAFNDSGLKSGDILVGVNGLSVNEPSAISKLSQLNNFKLDLVRGDVDLIIDVSVN